MNEERELLERWVSQFGNLRHDFNLLTKTKELLAQPEPIKEREVSGKIISTDDSCNWNLTVGGLKDYDHVYVNGIRYTEYQPDINTQYLLDQVSRLTAENAMIKEKWSEAQPEQEQEPVAWIDDGCNGLIKQDTIRGYVMPLYTAPPKREPLSDETIAKLWGESYSGTTQMVRNFARAIEQQHGIGGEDE